MSGNRRKADLQGSRCKHNICMRGHTFANPFSSIGLGKVFGEDEGSQRVSSSKQRRIREAPLDLLNSKVSVVREGCRVGP